MKKHSLAAFNVTADDLQLKNMAFGQHHKLGSAHFINTDICEVTTCPKCSQGDFISERILQI